MRPLGVGMVHWPALEPLYRERGCGLSVLEFEPQESWTQATGPGGGAPAYVIGADRLAAIAALPQRKIVHSVALPVGGSVRIGGEQATLVASVARALDAAWASEHLSFNAFDAGGAVFQTGFLMPPRQTPASVQLAAHNIREFGATLGVPFAFETGVNYLKPQSDELTDGRFFAAVAETADCGILLDLHNLWANERNGREPVASVLGELPLERVWEIHLAGGQMFGEYYLDAHSDGIAPELLDIAAQLIPRLRNLGAIVFEILPEHIDGLGLDGVRAQIAEMHALWRLRPPEEIHVMRTPEVAMPLPRELDAIRSYECGLANLAHGRATAEGRFADDPGIPVYRTLIDDARDGRLARAMRFTITLLLASLGRAAIAQVLSDFRAQSPVEIFSAVEADRFARFLRERLDRFAHVSYLAEVLEFEHALVRASLFGTSSRVTWSVDPTVLLAALEAGRLPGEMPQLESEMEICAG